jgi:hypothetical protein
MTQQRDKTRSNLTPILSIGAVATLALTAGGCTAGMRRAMGVEKVAPDEFRVVTQAPLVIPPDFNLRPPEPGEARPQDLQPDAAARTALLGPEFQTPMSSGEKALVASAVDSAGGVEPNVRDTVDLEGGDLAKKPKSFSDRILFFKGDGAPEAAKGSPLDSQTEADRLAEAEAAKNVTGGKAVVIEPKKQGIKLPGL